MYALCFKHSYLFLLFLKTIVFYWVYFMNGSIDQMHFSYSYSSGRDGVYHLKASSKADVITWLREIGTYITARDASESQMFALVGQESI